MPQAFDCAVIGGGVAGLGVACRLASMGYNVVLFEEDRGVGTPKHCTGLVSSATLSKLGEPARESKVRAFDRYIIKSTEGYELILRFGSNVHLLDRVRLERLMLAEAESLGAHVVMNCRVKCVRRTPSGFITYACSGSVRSEAIAVCEGAKRLLTRAIGLVKNVRNLLGLQAVVLCDDPPSTVTVYVGPEISRKFFGWCVPIEGRKVLVGVVDDFSKGGFTVRERLNRLLRVATRDFGCAEIKEFFGGLMPVDKPLYPAVGSDMLVVGDAASMVKPITGGGLYVISSVLKELEHIDLSKLELLNKRVRKLMNGLREQYLMAKIARFLGYYRLVGVVRLLKSDIFVENYDSLHKEFSAIMKRL